MRRTAPVLSIILAILLCQTSCRLAEERPANDVPFEAISSLGERIRIVSAPYFFDGRSIGITLRTDDGRELKCGVNRANIFAQNEDGSMSSVYPAGCLVIYGHHVTDEGAQILAAGSAAEPALIRAVQLAMIPREGSTDGYQTREDLEGTTRLARRD